MERFCQGISRHIIASLTHTVFFVVALLSHPASHHQTLRLVSVSFLFRGRASESVFLGERRGHVRADDQIDGDDGGDAADDGVIALDLRVEARDGPAQPGNEHVVHRSVRPPRRGEHGERVPQQLAHRLRGAQGSRSS